MKRRTPFTTEASNPFSLCSLALMLASAALRLCYYLPRPPHGAQLFGQLLLPLFSAGLYVLIYLLPRRTSAQWLCAPILGGVLFFILKALGFESALHSALCCALYAGVAVLFCLTLCGVLRSKLPVYAVTGAPLLAHLLSDAAQLARGELGAWQLEASVLCIMAALLCLCVSLKPAARPN